MASALPEPYHEGRQEGIILASGENQINFESEVTSHMPFLRGRKLTAAIAFVAGTGFTLFGYVPWGCK